MTDFTLPHIVGNIYSDSGVTGRLGFSFGVVDYPCLEECLTSSSRLEGRRLSR